MSFVAVNGHPLIEGFISMPSTGNWYAELLVSAESAEGLEDKLSITAGETTSFTATAMRARPWSGYVEIKACGGAGGLRDTTLTPKSYQSVPLNRVLSDIFDAAGETLAATSDASILATPLSAWVGVQQKAGVALMSLLRVTPSAVWRMLADGTLWVGVDTWPPSDLLPADYVLIEDKASLGTLKIAPELPTLRPGTTFLDHRISYVTHFIDAEEIHTTARYET